jgi:hypothetical protein
MEMLNELSLNSYNTLQTSIVTAFSLMAALAWNQAIQKSFAERKHLRNIGPYLYAVFITLLAVFVSYLSDKYLKIKIASGK